MSQPSLPSQPLDDRSERSRGVRKQWGLRLAAVLALHAAAIWAAVWFFGS